MVVRSAFAFPRLITAKEKFLKLSALKKYKRLNEAGPAGPKFSELFRGNIRKNLDESAIPPGRCQYNFLRKSKKLLDCRFR